MRGLRWMLVGAAAVALGCSSATSSTSGPPAGATVVTIANFSYSPDSVLITAGKTVYWTNNGPSGHTTTSDTGVWDSGTLSPPSGGGGYGGSSAGGSFTYTFNTPGTYTYHCKIHPPSMYPTFVGKIVVQ